MLLANRLSRVNRPRRRSPPHWRAPEPGGSWVQRRKDSLHEPTLLQSARVPRSSEQTPGSLERVVPIDLQIRKGSPPTTHHATLTPASAVIQEYAGLRRQR